MDTQAITLRVKRLEVEVLSDSLAEEMPCKSGEYEHHS